MGPNESPTTKNNSFLHLTDSKIEAQNRKIIGNGGGGLHFWLGPIMSEMDES
jgi:hypothetical protein